MGFTREVEDMGNGESTINFTPSDSHPWLEQVCIYRRNDGSNAVQIWFKEPNLPVEHTARDKASKKLEGLIQAFQFNPDLIDVQEVVDALRGRKERDEALSFEASPTSHVRSILNQSDLPKDIQVAVMRDLERIWSKTPD